MKRLIFSVFLVFVILLPMATMAQTSPPILAYPQNGSAVDPIYNLRLGWHRVSGAQGYQYQFDRYSSFPQNPTTSGNGVIADTSVGIIFLEPNLATGIWYWKVRVKDANNVWSGWSDVWTFNVVLGTPTAWLVRPQDGSSWTSSPFLAWQSNKPIDLQVATDGSFAGVVISEIGLTGSAYQTNLTSNTYYWRVRPQGGNWTPVWSFSVHLPIPIPDIPMPATPANGFSSTTSPSLSWNSAANAASYNLQVATDVNFVGLVLNQAGLTSTSYQTNLSPNTYYWRVSATNGAGTSGYSSAWSFTITSPPATPTASLVSPANGSSTPTSPPLTWSAQNATSFNLQVATNASFTDLQVSYIGFTNLRYQTNLPSGTYYWRVQPMNGTVPGQWTEAWIFTITPATPIPDVPTLSSPANGFSSTTSPSLSWNPAANATTYNLQVATDAGFTNLVVNQAGLSGTSYQTNLSPNTYYWRVSATNGAGTSGYSSVRSFTITPPAAPTLLFPPDNSLSSSSSLFRWSLVIGAMSYTLQVATDSNFTNVVANQNIATPSYQTQLVPNIYFWRVSSTGAVGTGPWSEVWSFTVTPVILVPSIPTLLSPANGSSSTTSPLLVWNTSANAASYNLQVATNANFTNLVVNQTGLTNLSYQSQLSVGTYYWRVSAANTGVETDWSTIWSFTITVTTPSAPVAVAPIKITATEFTANWNSVSNTTAYRLDVSTNQLFGSFIPGYQDLAVNSTSQKVTGLTPNTTYYYRVRAINGGGASPNSNTISVKTLIAPPAAPILISPPDATINQPVEVTLVWSGDAVTYHLEVSVNSTFGSLVFGDSTLTAISSKVSGLAYNTTHYWRVRAKNAGGVSGWSERSFQTRPALVVMNPFLVPMLVNSSRVFRYYLNNPPLFAGNIGALAFAASSSNPAVCTASILKPDTLVVTGLWSGEATVTVIGTDTDGTVAFYTTPAFQLITDVEDFGEIPGKFELSQNYPNPFNPSTSIKYQVSSSAYTTLVVYDILGKEVATLVNEEKFPGSYEVTFNASNLSSGIYFYTLQAGKFTQTRKMLLLK